MITTLDGRKVKREREGDINWLFSPPRSLASHHGLDLSGGGGHYGIIARQHELIEEGKGTGVVKE